MSWRLAFNYPEPYNLVRLEISSAVLNTRSVWISDRNAATLNPHFFKGWEGLKNVPWDDVRTSSFRYGYDAGKKARRSAEVLIPLRIPPRFITGITVHDEEHLALLRKSLPQECFDNLTTQVDRTLLTDGEIDYLTNQGAVR